MESLRVSFFLAWRSITRSNYGIAFSTIVMVTLIYMSLLFLPSLIQGAVNRVDNLVTDTLTSDLIAMPSNGATSIDNVGSYLRSIRQTSGVAQATATYRVGNQISHGSTSGSWTVDAIDPSSYATVFTTPSSIFAGKYLNTNDTNKIFLGINIAGANQTSIKGYRTSLKTVRVGDTVNVTLNNGKTVPFIVAGIYNNDFAASDDTAFITTNEAQTLVPASTDHAQDIYVKTNDGANVNTVMNRLQSLRIDAQFNTSADIATTVQDQTQTFRLISKILKLVSLIMAAITIFIVTYVDLVNKRKQIGIERAIGIKSGAIVTSYVLKAWVYALIGIILGWALFKHVAIPLVQQHPFQFPNGPVTLASNSKEMRRDVVILLVVAFIAAIIPAAHSVRIKILDAIWGK